MKTLEQVQQELFRRIENARKGFCRTPNAEAKVQWKEVIVELTDLSIWINNGNVRQELQLIRDRVG